ncbi:Uncharacterised protein [Streptococcus pneumoniae]|nr:Uncharacterised protein [Streptococcus pneumoniae]CKE93841.1 Uncharacterised protein [Streptococcus pneumoniae]CKE95330.1 Uncharacterised protein [Streptococcus pneumoniae]CKF21693.1 Uncharacterised protein [Streptococcus pneumoniae]CKF56330.1 Uncharacterised protein [Streptococcus pneumoniae]
MFSIITIIKGLKVPQGTGRIFFRFATENLHPFRFATSLPNFFWLEFWRHQADTSKSNYYDHRLEFAIIRAKPLVLSTDNFTYHINRYVIRGGSSPHDEPASTPKAKKNLLLNLFILFFKHLFLFSR